MMPPELTNTIAKLRREMRHNVHVMALCDAYEMLRPLVRRQRSANPPLTRAEIQKNYRLRKKGMLT